jgi:hypothetical protein
MKFLGVGLFILGVLGAFNGPVDRERMGDWAWFFIALSLIVVGCWLFSN